ncbi:hypothetical protein WICPIJ_004058 [Wickerhamomyces pijperi]|uniref:Ribosomal RNA-processing protein 40 n=1 Tax=Wickerhamomyces pijperi TaxID=599730 RepID=A0A9P8TNA2_WICPI|nr:hypothetical protein WICPIJ_004058 [Wickerhamomyces pijperi]
MSHTLILPGDKLPVSSDSAVIIGPGIHNTPISKEIIPITAGILQLSGTQKTIHLEYNSRRYIPQVNDLVVGVVTGSFGDVFRVSLSDFTANVSLSAFAFPNATKKNRPNLKIGNLVYARVSAADPIVDVEIECMDPTTGKDGGFGLLEDGYVFTVGLAFARSLLYNADHAVLDLLVKRCQFEIAIGVNGKIWIKTDELKHTLACAKAIEGCQFVQGEQFKDVVNQCFKDLGL